MPAEPIDLDKLEALAKEAIRIRKKGRGTGWSAVTQEKALHKLLDPATVLVLVARARRADELQARMAVMDRLYAVARDVAIDMGDWPIDVTFGESGRDWIKRLDGARTDVELYDAQSPARARERAYLSTIAPSPDPTTWKEP